MICKTTMIKSTRHKQNINTVTVEMKNNLSNNTDIMTPSTTPEMTDKVNKTLIDKVDKTLIKIENRIKRLNNLVNKSKRQYSPKVRDTSKVIVSIRHQTSNISNVTIPVWHQPVDISNVTIPIWHQPVNISNVTIPVGTSLWTSVM